MGGLSLNGATSMCSPALCVYTLRGFERIPTVVQIYRDEYLLNSEPTVVPSFQIYKLNESRTREGGVQIKQHLALYSEDVMFCISVCILHQSF